ncbi:hypothetical protein BDA96_01G194000 [Sorghum bicolor]|uniref:Uncharacterized protein n=1 Tax=Sorghum bicolor TaxID=4558 RepID=A0A921RZ56_SORBI|nr:hypothetical protein BDA96_01G194000 [Sorghum bicolor]
MSTEFENSNGPPTWALILGEFSNCSRRPPRIGPDAASLSPTPRRGRVHRAASLSSDAGRGHHAPTRPPSPPTHRRHRRPRPPSPPTPGSTAPRRPAPPCPDALAPPANPSASSCPCAVLPPPSPISRADCGRPAVHLPWPRTSPRQSDISMDGSASSGGFSLQHCMF